MAKFKVTTTDSTIITADSLEQAERLVGVAEKLTWALFPPKEGSTHEHSITITPVEEEEDVAKEE